MALKSAALDKETVYLKHFGKMPGNGFSLPVRVCSQNQLLDAGLVQCVFDGIQAWFGRLRYGPGHLEVG